MRRRWYSYALAAALVVAAVFLLHARSHGGTEAADAGGTLSVITAGTDGSGDALPPADVVAAAEAEPASVQVLPDGGAGRAGAAVTEDGEYDGKDEVALYVHRYGHLPANYITKASASALGWTGGSLEPYAPGKSIGGDRFGNREGLLPRAKGRTYTECDIGTRGKKSRGAKRIVFSDDGLVYYTGDHYASFELLYGEE